MSTSWRILNTPKLVTLSDRGSDVRQDRPQSACRLIMVFKFNNDRRLIATRQKYGRCNVGLLCALLWLQEDKKWRVWLVWLMRLSLWVWLVDLYLESDTDPTDSDIMLKLSPLTTHTPTPGKKMGRQTYNVQVSMATICGHDSKLSVWEQHEHDAHLRIWDCFTSASKWRYEFCTWV